MESKDITAAEIEAAIAQAEEDIKVSEANLSRGQEVLVGLRAAESEAVKESAELAPLAFAAVDSTKEPDPSPGITQVAVLIDTPWRQNYPTQARAWDRWQAAEAAAVAAMGAAAKQQAHLGLVQQYIDSRRANLHGLRELEAVHQRQQEARTAAIGKDGPLSLERLRRRVLGI